MAVPSDSSPLSSLCSGGVGAVDSGMLSILWDRFGTSGSAVGVVFGMAVLVATLLDGLSFATTTAEVVLKFCLASVYVGCLLSSMTGLSNFTLDVGGLPEGEVFP